MPPRISKKINLNQLLEVKAKSSEATSEAPPEPVAIVEPTPPPVEVEVPEPESKGKEKAPEEETQVEPPKPKKKRAPRLHAGNAVTSSQAQAVEVSSNNDSSPDVHVTYGEIEVHDIPARSEVEIEIEEPDLFDYFVLIVNAVYLGRFILRFI